MAIRTILFPSSYFDGKRVDEDLQAEYEAAVSIGLWDVIFFDYNQWFNDGKLVLSRRIDEEIQAVYRGWMMNAEQYLAFYEALEAVGVCLKTTPEEYRHFHYFPNVYEDIREDTPGMIAVPQGEPYHIRDIQKQFDRFMVKDYVKSVKGTEFPRYFTRDITETEFQKWMEVFYRYRGSLLAGGLCFKEYVDLAVYGDKTNEYRVFYINHEPATISRNSLQMKLTPEPPRTLIEQYRHLPSPFYTLDYAELADGSWKILEAGDGGVSGPSEGQDLKAFFRALYWCLN